MQLKPVPYMRWAKGIEPHLHNLANSGIYNLLTQEDLGIDFEAIGLTAANADGLPALREAIAARYSVDPQQVLAAEGTSGANFLTLAAWVRPGDPVLLEEPYYQPLGHVLFALGAKVTRVAVDGPDGHATLLGRLEAASGPRWRAVVMTNPHNPTGRRVDEERLARLAEACQRSGARLFVDEAYREFLFEEPAGCACHTCESVVSTSSLTKSYGLGALRIGWAIGPRDLIRHAIEIHDNLGVVHPAMTELIGARLLSDPSRLEAWRKKARERVDQNRALLNSFLESDARFEGGMPPTGLIAFPRWAGSATFPDAETVCERARAEAGIALVPGRFFQRPDRIRLSVGSPGEEVRRALDALQVFLSP